MFLKPRRGPFSGEPSRWSFTLGDAAIRNVRIRDESFLAKCDTGEYRLNQADLLRVRLLTRQKVAGGKLEISYEIPEVLEYTPGAQQGALLPPADAQ